MDFKRMDIGNATEAVRLLLEELALEEYRFSVGLREPESAVHVEYAANDGWRSVTLTVPDATLLKSREERDVRSGLAATWRQKLVHARRRVDEREDRRAEAIALGRNWADEQAERLRDSVPGADWPDFWSEADNGPLPLGLGWEERGEMFVAATRAAQERWRDLRDEQVRVESLEEDEGQAEAAAAELEASLRNGLPSGVTAARDGSGVYLLSSADDQARSVASLKDAVLVLEDLTEGRNGSTRQ